MRGTIARLIVPPKALIGRRILKYWSIANKAIHNPISARILVRDVFMGSPLLVLHYQHGPHGRGQAASQPPEWLPTKVMPLRA
jgi:hypothetical protein